MPGPLQLTPAARSPAMPSAAIYSSVPHKPATRSTSSSIPYVEVEGEKWDKVTNDFSFVDRGSGSTMVTGK